MEDRTPKKSFSAMWLLVSVVVAIPFVVLLGALILGLMTANAMNPPDDFFEDEVVYAQEPPVDVAPELDIAALGTPSLVTAVAKDHDTQFLEIELLLPPGDEDLQFAIENPFDVAIGYAGIAVRSETQATLVRSGEITTLDRPAGCEDGCRTFVWVTMYRFFQDEHPDAVLYAFAGDDALATIEEIEAYPPQMFGS